MSEFCRFQAKKWAYHLYPTFSKRHVLSEQRVYSQIRILLRGSLTIATQSAYLHSPSGSHLNLLKFKDKYGKEGMVGRHKLLPL